MRVSMRFLHSGTGQVEEWSWNYDGLMSILRSGLPEDIEMLKSVTLPGVTWSIPEAEREQQAKELLSYLEANRHRYG